MNYVIILLTAYNDTLTIAKKKKKDILSILSLIPEIIMNITKNKNRCQRSAYF